MAPHGQPDPDPRARLSAHDGASRVVPVPSPRPSKPAPSPPGEIEAVRGRVVMIVIGTTALVAPLLAAFIVLREIADGMLTAISVPLAFYTLAFPVLWLGLRSLGPARAGALYIALTLGMTFAIQCRGGVTASAVSLQLFAVILAGLLFGRAGAGLSLTASLGLFAVAGVGVVQGYLPPVVHDFWDPGLGPVWIRAGVILAALGGAAALAVSTIVGALEREAGALRAALERERGERAARERAEIEREEARAALRAATRLEMLGRMASGVAHDYNNLLAIIQAAADTAQASPGLPGPVSECLRDISHAARGAAEFTERLLLLGRKGIGQPESVDISKQLLALRGAIQRMLPDGIAFEVHASGSPSARVDPVQLERAVLNLVLNARDAIGDAGVIDVAIEPSTEPPAATGLPCGRYVAVHVRDDGQGMDEEVRARIFEPFFTTKHGAGTGIGMAFVQSFVEEASGAAVVESTPGVGTRVTLYLPELGESGERGTRADPPSPLGI